MRSLLAFWIGGACAPVVNTIEGAGFDKLWAAQREPRKQYAAVAGVKAMGAVK